MLHKPLVKESISQAWNSPHTQDQATVSYIIILCRKALSKWKKQNFTNALDNIEMLQERLESEQSSEDPVYSQVLSLKKELCIAYRDEELFWSQKSSEGWLKEGYENTKYFHGSVKTNRKGRLWRCC